MVRGRQRRLFAPTLVLVALVGTWLAHTLEYLHVAGGAGLRAELFGSVHAYMLPVGALLLGLSAAGGVGWWRAWQAMGRRLEAVHSALAATFRGHRTVAPPTITATPSGAARLGSLVMLLVALQLGLYLVQENLEAGISGAPMPGLSAVLGAHAAAPLVHLAVATLLANLMAIANRTLRRRGERISGVARLLVVLLAILAPTPPPPAPAAAWRPSALDRLGRHLWSRPPPTALPAR
ncbi:MAG TPA: hypothetical protein VGL20_20395 [Candidatus Dormibacteraeota bacterium]